MSWRERNAPYGLQQLALRFGTTVEHLLTRPDVIAAAIGTMEGGQRGARHVAESFLDFVDRNGGGREGVLKAIPHYDTMVMANPRQIGNLSQHQNMTIARLDPQVMKPTIAHVAAVQSGQAQRLVPEGYTKNFSAPYAGMPGGGRNYRHVQAPDGSVHIVPDWAVGSVGSGKYMRGPSGEYLVPETGQQPFKVSWSSATAHPGMAPATPPGNVYASGQPIPPGHNPVTTIPEGRMALGAPGIAVANAEAPPPQPVAAPPVIAPTYISEDKNTPWPGEPGFAPPQPDYFDNKDGTGEEMVNAPSQQPQPKIPPITINAPPRVGQATNVGDAPDPAGDAIRQQAVNNQAQINRAQQAERPQLIPSLFGASGPFAGSFFNRMDGSGFKSGGAVKASKDTAKYRGHPNRGDKCRDCSMFTAPHGCTSVRGAISPYGWCSYFEATPTAVALAIKKAAAQVERNPTELQKEHGNYSMGHFNWNGLEITLENPKGSIRRGKTWEVKMPAGYGYIKKTLGKDGDHVDVYVGDDHASDKVFVIDQIDAASGKFDEHKCMLSFKTQAQAVATYNKGFSDGKGPDRLGAVSELPVEKFKDWLKGDTKKPLGKIVRRRAEGGRVQDLDALSKGLQPLSPMEQAALNSHKKFVAGTNALTAASMEPIPAPTPEQLREYEAMKDRMTPVMQGIDALRPPEHRLNGQKSDNVEIRRADGGRVQALDTARKYSRGR